MEIPAAIITLIPNGIQMPSPPSVVVGPLAHARGWIKPSAGGTPPPLRNERDERLLRVGELLRCPSSSASLPAS